jgi:hypothetical protein
MPNRFIQVFDTDHGWNTSRGKIVIMSQQKVERIKELADMFRIWTLVPLMQKDSELEFLTATKVNGRMVVELKLRRSGFPDTTLDFDQSTGLLVRTLRIIKSIPVEGDSEEVSIGKWADHGTFKFPAEYTYSFRGRVCGKFHVRDCKALAEIDDAMFAKPSVGGSP